MPLAGQWLHLRRLKIVLAAAWLLLTACGEPAPEAVGSAPPISGAALDELQSKLRETLDRDFAGARAERVRVERTSDGARAVVHASLAATFNEAEYERICRAISETASSTLVEGQSLELYLLHGEEVVHSCGP
jgi:hypothetical protein